MSFVVALNFSATPSLARWHKQPSSLGRSILLLGSELQEDRSQPSPSVRSHQAPQGQPARTAAQHAGSLPASVSVEGGMNLLTMILHASGILLWPQNTLVAVCEY